LRNAFIERFINRNLTSLFARTDSSSKNACSNAEDFPRHNAPIITGGKSGNGTKRTFAGVFARGTSTASPIPKPFETYVSINQSS